MEIVLACNFDPALVDRTRELPVVSFFGNFPTSLTGGGRPPQILPTVDEGQFRAYIDRVHAGGRTFYATINSSDLGLQEYRPRYLEAFGREIGRLVELGVDGFVVALPVLLQWIHREYPHARLTVSSFARIRSVAQAEYFARMGADTVVIEEANRDLKLLGSLAKTGVDVEVLVNQTCIHECPYRSHHLNTSSLSSQHGVRGPKFEYPILQCGLELVRDPVKLVSGIFVRPEDLEVLEEVGVHRFKVSGRNRTTDWLVRAVSAYAARRYDGNLLDILSYVQNLGPRGALRRLASDGRSPEVVTPLAEGFEALARMEIDNAAIPRGFLRRIAATDCAHTLCSTCGYCATVARKAVRVGGRPLTEYRPPDELPDAFPLLELLGPDPVPPHAVVR